ncbi:MAG: peroxide stress protein YaaA [Flavobacteriales bacterium]|nr:peroxide stress protein YaaA [Flavobacteriales bacterium]
MKVLLSPAKSLNFDKAIPTNKQSQSQFLTDSQKVHKVLVKKKPKELAELMGISDKLVNLNWQRNQDWQVPFPEAIARQAVYAFDGDVYVGLDVYTLPDDKIDALQDTVRILSGLYGMLKPLDVILPYRLEMGTKLPIGTKKNLYEFWKTKLTKELNEELTEGELLVNLASKEYATAIDFKKIKGTVISPEFKNYKNGKLKIISFFAKKARGLMARYIIDNNIDSVEGLKGFNVDGYAFDESLSTNTQLVFTR